MKNIFRIYKRDMKKICTNWAAAVMIVILIIIPSLYSLINIKASWDPYANTNGIKIAVVNEDKGTVFKDQDINIGKELIENLQDNNQLGWEFVDKETAENGLKLEKYYATIEIPENFSEDVTTVVDKQVIKPKLIYTVNEKKNAIAPKLTDAGIKTLKNQLDENIVKTVSGIIFRICNESGIELQNNKPDIRQAVDNVYDLEKNMPELEELLNSSIDGTTELKNLLVKVDEMIPTVSDTIDSTDDFLQNSKEYLDKAQSDLSDISPIVKEDLVTSENLLDTSSTAVDNLDDNILPDAAKKTLSVALDSAKATQATVEETRDKLKSIQKFIDKVSNIEIPNPIINKNLQSLEEIQKLQDNVKQQVNSLKSMQDSLKETSKIISSTLDKLDTIDQKLGIAIDKIDEEIKKLDNGEKLDIPMLKDIKDLLDEVNKLVSDTIDSYDSEIVPGVDSAFNSVREIIDNGLSLVKESRDSLPQMENLLGSFQDASDLSNDELKKLKDKFPDMKEKIYDLSSKLKEMDNNNELDDAIDMLTNDWNSQSTFMASPVEIDDNRLFPWPNYGSSSAPFYIVLCLWVGGLIGSALLSLHVQEFEEGIKIRPYQVYLGKLLLFYTIGILQALVASLGALFILKAYAVHSIIFVLYSIFVSLVFITMIYTAASLLDDVGKAVIVFILVLQLAGSSGNFPIEVTPPIFHKIYPYLPFTYATNGMRQVMAGIVYPILFKDLYILGGCMGVSLILGILFKGIMNKGAEPIMKKLFQSEILRH